MGADKVLEPTLGCQELGAAWGHGMGTSSCVFWGGEEIRSPSEQQIPKKNLLETPPGCLSYPSRIHPLCHGGVEHGVQTLRSKTMPCTQKSSTQHHQAQVHRSRTRCLCHSSISVLRFSSGESCKGTAPTKAPQSCAMYGAFAIAWLLSTPLEQLYGKLKSFYQSKALK